MSGIVLIVVVKKLLKIEFCHMNKLIFFIVGLVLILLGFFAFSYIGYLNGLEILNFNNHLLLVGIGFLLQVVGIYFMILLIKN